MNLFNRNRILDFLVVGEKDLMDEHPFAREEQDIEEGAIDQGGMYYCGTCNALVPISEYRTHIHTSY